MEIYVLIDNQPHGPYTPELIQQYLKSGQLQPTDLAAYAGSADWKPLSTLMHGAETQAPAKGTRFGTVPVAAQPRQRAKKGKLALAVVGGIVLLLAGAGGFFWWKYFGNSGPEVKVVTPAKPGLPNTLAELNTWYVEPPTGQNAATFMDNGFSAMQITDADRNSKDLPLLGQGAWPPLGTPLPLKTKSAIAGLVQRNKAVWPPFQQAAKFDQARYPIDLNQGSGTLLPHLAKLKQAVQFVGLTGSLLADNKQAQPATDVLLTALACTQSLKYEPLLISQLVRATCLGIVTTNLERVVNSVSLPPAQLERLAGAFGKAEAEESTGTPFTRACAGERVMGLVIFDLPPDKLESTLKAALNDGSTGDSVGGTLAIKMLTRNLKSQRAFNEETFNHSIAMRDQLFPDRLKVDEYFTSRVAEAKTNQFKLCMLLMPALAKVANKEAGGLVELRLAQTAIALERFRRANNNRYPATLSELVPALLPVVPQDPFDGEPLSYNKNGDGYELNSVGAAPAKSITFKMISPPKLSSSPDTALQ